MAGSGVAVRRRLALLSLAALNAALAAAAWTRQPWANGPAEWRWEYLPAGGGGAGPGGASPGAGAGGGLLASGAAAAVVVAALAGLALLLGWRRLRASRGALPLALGCGAALTFGLVAAQPGGFARVTAALVSRNSFGYVWDAALAPPGRALLADYPAASAGLNQHSVTHPPGPLLAVRALGFLDRALPAPAAGTSGLPAQAAAAVAHEVARARGHGRPVPQPPPGAWTVAALAVLLPALSVLAAWPLHRLALAWGCGRTGALLAAVLWLLVPARSLFTPSFDQALPAALLGAAWLAAGGGRWRTATAGLLLFAACFLSYGCLSVLPLVVACALAATGPEATGEQLPQAAAEETAPDMAAEEAAPDTAAKVAAPDMATGPTAPDTAGTAAPAGAGVTPAWTARLVALGLGFALPYLALAVFAGHDPWHAMRAALALHHQIAVEPRSYLTWLLWNPYDFALLLSPGLLGLAALAAIRAARTVGGFGAAGGSGALGTPTLRGAKAFAVWCWWGLLGLLLLSGSVRGEVGRIWLIWMPFACLFAAAWLTRPAADAAGLAGADNGATSTVPADGAAGRRELALLLATQAALLLALAARMVFVS